MTSSTSKSVAEGASSSTTGGWAIKRMCIGGEIRTPSDDDDEEASTPPPPDVDDLMQAPDADEDAADDEDALPSGWKQLCVGGYADLSGDWDEFPSLCVVHEDVVDVADHPSQDPGGGGIRGSTTTTTTAYHHHRPHHPLPHQPHHTHRPANHHHHRPPTPTISMPASTTALLIATPVEMLSPVDAGAHRPMTSSSSRASIRLHSPIIYENEIALASAAQMPTFYSRETLLLDQVEEERGDAMREEEEEEGDENGYGDDWPSARNTAISDAKCQTEV